MSRDPGVTDLHAAWPLQSERRLVKEPAAAYRFLNLDFFHGFLDHNTQGTRCALKYQNKRTFSLPPPMLDFRIILEARNPARRCWRQYRVEAGTDLFGVWVVEISYGRIGTTGRSRCFVVRDEGEARHLARSILKRRASAAATDRGRVPRP